MLTDWGGRPRPPEVAYQQFMWGVPRVDLMDIINLGPDATIEDLKDLNPLLDELTETTDEWKADQLLYMKTNPRSMTPYGFGPLEQGLLPASIILARQTWQWEYYRSGSLPAVFLDPGETIANAEEARQLQEAINMMGGDTGAKHQVIVIPPGAKTYPQKDTDLTNQFDEWLAALMCMPFGLSISDLGITPKVASLQSPNASKTAANSATDRTTRRSTIPRAKKLKKKIFDRVIQKTFGQKDMMWSWGIIEEGESKEDKTTRVISLVDKKIASIDEARIELEMDPLGLATTTVPVVITATGQIIPLSDNASEPAPAPPALGEGGAPTATAADGTQAALPPGKPSNGNGNGKPKKPGKKPKPNGNGGNGNGKPAPSPAHAGSESVEASPPKDSDTAERTSKAVSDEMAVLRRYLHKGRDVRRFQSVVLHKGALLAGKRGSDPTETSALVAAAQARLERRDTDLADVQAQLLGELADAVRAQEVRDLSPSAALGAARSALGEAVRASYHAGSLASMADLSVTVDELPGAARRAADKAAKLRVTEQSQFLRDFLTDASAGATPAELAQRASLWGDGLTAPYEQGFVDTSEAVGQARAEVMVYRWNLGDSEHCNLCLDRDGKTFTSATLPGFPGDGGFGSLATICLGGARCACWIGLEDAQGHVLGSTRRPSAARDISMGEDVPWMSGSRPDLAPQLEARDAQVAEQEAADAAIREKVPWRGKDFSMGSPLASGFAPFDLEPGVRGIYPEPTVPEELRERKKKPRKRKKGAQSAADAAAPGVKAAGLVVRAEDTGRVLLLQRAMPPSGTKSYKALDTSLRLRVGDRLQDDDPTVLEATAPARGPIAVVSAAPGELPPGTVFKVVGFSGREVHLAIDPPGP